METYGAGVVVFLFNQEGDILIGKRKGAHGAGTWSLPGGKIEFMEEAMLCVAMELEEETGIVLPSTAFKPREWLDNIWVDPDKGQQHWITLFTEADLHDRQQPKVTEPDKCEEWRWADPAILLKGKLPLFHPLEQFLIKFPWGGWPRYQQNRSGKNNRHIWAP
jgi:8-oxo-dGTP diphosphatase